MVKEYQQVEETQEVPKGVGIEGFLRVVREILKLPRIQDVRIDSKGKVSYTYFLREGESKKALGVSFETLTPYALVRNGELVELPYDPHADACVVLARLFRMASIDHMFPVAFVGGANTWFWNWYVTTTKLDVVTKDELFGIPFLTDRQVEDEVLVLATSFGRHGELIDTRRSYKATIPKVKT